ncbi:cation:proton antiporter [Proteiniclasticum ruminis]|nr:cation:proton antiporter [Proteiniclasticum ruminis]
MLFSLALIFLLGMFLGNVFEKLGLPKLLGMLLTGVLLGPYMLNYIDGSILGISSELRKIALIIILTRAGLNLDLKDLRKVGRPAMLLCFVPAVFEILGVTLLAPKFLGLGILDALILGTVVAAVSPAVIVPRMLKLMENGYGRDQKIPQMIMAGASVDDVFVIVLFTAFTGFALTGEMHLGEFLSIPVAIVLGVVTGGFVGLFLSWVFTRFHIRDTGKVLVILSMAFLLVSLEEMLQGIVGFSGLLAVMAMGILLQEKKYEVAKRLSGKFSKLWVAAELLLFVLVGASVNLSLVLTAGLPAVLLVLLALLFRILGVFLSLLKTPLTRKERAFSAMAYLPKATVQAAIGGLPLAMGLPSGEIILTVAVVSIVLTAPLGAILVDRSYKRLLVRSK